MVCKVVFWKVRWGSTIVVVWSRFLMTPNAWWFHRFRTCECFLYYWIYWTAGRTQWSSISAGTKIASAGCWPLFFSHPSGSSGGKRSSRSFLVFIYWHWVDRCSIDTFWASLSKTNPRRTLPHRRISWDLMNWVFEKTELHSKSI